MHFIDDDRVLALAEPTDGKNRRVAAAAAEKISTFMEQALSGSESTSPRAPATPDTTGELHELAAGFRKWTSARTEGFPKMPVEKQIYSAFRDLVLFVMRFLKDIMIDPPEGCCLLLPYSKGSDFKPVDSNESDKLDQVLVVCGWDSSVAGVVQAKYADTFAVVEVKRVEKVSFDGSSRAFRDGGAVLLNARQQLVRYNRQIYEHQHNRMFTWGLTVCDSLVRACLFGPDRVLSSEDIDVATPDGRRVLVRLLVNLCLCEESRRGYIPTIQQHENADVRYWTIRCNRISSSGEKEPELATFYSRGPAMAADRNFGRHTRGFPAAERLEEIDSPTLFAKVAWHYVERGAAGEQRSELQHLSRIRKEFENSTDPDLHVPLLQAGGLVAVSTDGGWQDMTTDAIYGPEISQAYGERQDSVVDADEDTEHACIPHRQLVVAVMSPCGVTLDS
ncbi:hypothetical protein GQ54DRAFT_307123, partial [Martensiomyces pterosporus]